MMKRLPSALFSIHIAVKWVGAVMGCYCIRWHLHVMPSTTYDVRNHMLPATSGCGAALFAN